MDCPPRLSPRAARLLAALRDAGAVCPARALTDRALAQLTDIAQRDIVNVAAELLAAGVLSLATCAPPAGRFVLLDGADLAPAYAYLRSLERRAKAVLARRRDLRLAISAAERRRSPDSRGQLSLFGVSHA